MKKFLFIVLFLSAGIVFSQEHREHHRPPDLPPEVREAMIECEFKIGFVKKEGVHPTKEQMDQIFACMKEKGFAPPERPERKQPDSE